VFFCSLRLSGKDSCKPQRFFYYGLPEQMDDTRKAEAIAAARHEIARRIAKFCTSLSSEDFDRLLDRMAFVQWKYDVLPNVPSDSDSSYETTDIAR
jgi:hypothetical protein